MEKGRILNAHGLVQQKTAETGCAVAVDGGLDARMVGTQGLLAPTDLFVKRPLLVLFETGGAECGLEDDRATWSSSILIKPGNVVNRGAKGCTQYRADFASASGKSVAVRPRPSDGRDFSDWIETKLSRRRSETIWIFPVSMGFQREANSSGSVTGSH